MAEYHCLVVEDSPMMRQMLVFALSRVRELRVTEADDGVDGLRKLAGARFDIVLTDLNMPIMDGLKLVRRVRLDPTHKDVPIVVITTEGAEAIANALALGATAYLTARACRRSSPRCANCAASGPPETPVAVAPLYVNLRRHDGGRRASPSTGATAVGSTSSARARCVDAPQRRIADAVRGRARVSAWW